MFILPRQTVAQNIQKFGDCVPAYTIDFGFSSLTFLLFLIFFQAIKNSPGCIQPLVSRVLPFVGPIMNKVRLSKLNICKLHLEWSDAP